VAPLALVFVLVSRLSKRVEPLSEKARHSAGEVSSILSDVFNNVQTIKTSAAVGHVLAEFRRRNAKRLSDAMRSEVYFTLVSGLNSGLIEIAAGLVLLAGAGAIRRGTFTAGDFVLFSAYLQAVLGIFRWSGSLVGALKRHGVSIDRMEALMPGEGAFAPVRKRKLGLSKVPEIELELGPDRHGTLRTLEVRGLSYRYPRRKDEEREAGGGSDGGAGNANGNANGNAGAGGVDAASADDRAPFALEDVDFELEGGTLTVITGPVGCGKSTLLRCVLALLPASGTVRWNGVEVPGGTEIERSAFWKAPRCAYTPQVPRLFSDSIEGNILLGVPRGRVDLEALAAAACLEPDLAEMPERFDTQIGPRGVRLSGGQVQRVAAARMFARGASLNVLDDISSALDVVTEQKLWDRLATGDPERTWLVASHREALFKRADLILLMDSGRIVARGTFGELSASSPLFRELLRRETAAAEG
ncbi:MAG TPA: ABC transporter ATP-binding protein, partial [Spirochaetales bacterium]|nr:ABC transporter ATP-binding protein [Spirochaetales bacterium]